MAEAAERLAEVAGDAADVAALAAGHLEDGGVAVGRGDELEALDVERAGGEVEGLAGAGEVVGALAVDLDGGDLRRDLQDVAGEGGERGADRRPASGGRRRWRGRAPSASSVAVAAPQRTVKR